MAYPDAIYNVPIQDTVIGGGPAIGVSLGTSTATASTTSTFTGTAGTQVNGTFRLPVFKAPINIKGIRVYTVTASGSGVSGLTFAFLNGTATVGTAAAAAAGTYVDVSLTAMSTDSHGVITGPSFFTSSNNEMTMVNVAVTTGSGSSLGSFSVDLIWQNLNQ